MTTAKETATPAPAKNRLILVTGLSGAGRSSALNVLEDLGYEAVNNLPLFLLSGFVRQDSLLPRPLAVGVDTRTRDFSVPHFLSEIATLRAMPALQVDVLFLECDDDVLSRRFTETRRRHPLAADRPVSDGIRQERGLLAPLHEAADLVINTSSLSLGQFKGLMEGHYGLEKKPGIIFSVVSFSYREGLPREADLVFDVRFLKNPHYEESLRPLSGLDPAVGDFIAGDPAFGSFFSHLTDMLYPLLPRYEAEGKSYLTFAVGCTGGRHRSVFVAEKLAQWLRSEGRRVSLYHRDLETASLRRKSPGDE